MESVAVAIIILMVCAIVLFFMKSRSRTASAEALEIGLEGGLRWLCREANSCVGLAEDKLAMAARCLSDAEEYRAVSGKSPSQKEKELAVQRAHVRSCKLIDAAVHLCTADGLLQEAATAIARVEEKLSRVGGSYKANCTADLAVALAKRTVSDLNQRHLSATRTYSLTAERLKSELGGDCIDKQLKGN